MGPGWKKVAIQITMLTAQSKSLPLLNKLWADFDELFGIALQGHTEQFFKFWGGDLNHHTDSPNRKSWQHRVMSCFAGNLCALSALIFIKWYTLLYYYCIIVCMKAHCIVSCGEKSSWNSLSTNTDTFTSIILVHYCIKIYETGHIAGSIELKYQHRTVFKLWKQLI